MAMKFIYLLVSILLCINIVNAAYFYDDFEDGVVAPWTCTYGDCYEAYGGIWSTQYDSMYTYNLTSEEGFDFTGSWESQFTVHNSILSSNSYTCLYFSDGVYPAYGDGVFICPNKFNENEIFSYIHIFCSGECTCTEQAVPVVDMFRFNNDVLVNYNSSTGSLVVNRDDGTTASTILSGCAFEDYQIGLLDYDFDSSFYQFSMNDFGGGCSPNWTCSGYSACNTSDLQACNNVTDQNACGDTYTGDYSEFTPQACDYCTPNWSCSSFGECNESNVEPCLAVTDGNICGESFTGNLDDYDEVCIYVPPAAPAPTTQRTGGAPPPPSEVVSTSRSADLPKNNWEAMSDEQQKMVFIVGGLIIGYFLVTTGSIGGGRKSR